MADWHELKAGHVRSDSLLAKPCDWIDECNELNIIFFKEGEGGGEASQMFGPNHFGPINMLSYF